MKIRLIIIILTEVLLTSVNGQSTYKERRDWLVGEYAGFYKDSTAQSKWYPVTIFVTYSSNKNPLDDSTVLISIPNNIYKIRKDSTIIPFAWHDTTNSFIGKYYKDSIFEYWFYVPFPMSGGHLEFYRVKKVKSYVATSDNSLSNLIQLFPNPTLIGRVNIKVEDKIRINKCSLYSYFGVLVNESNFNFKNNLLSLHGLNSGIYFVHLSTNLGNIVKKIIVL